MHWTIHPVGKPSFSWVRKGVEEYEKRLGRYAKVSLKPVKGFEGFSPSSKAKLIVLDERGEGHSTKDLAETVQRWEDSGCREVVVCLGDADGVGEALRQQADLILSFGPQTLMHELALLVWMEQLYRIHTLNAGHPYHRE